MRYAVPNDPRSTTNYANKLVTLADTNQKSNNDRSKGRTHLLHFKKRFSRRETFEK